VVTVFVDPSLGHVPTVRQTVEIAPHDPDASIRHGCEK
jgi:hypothetical protein